MGTKYRKIIWTKRVYDFFCDAGNLSKIDREILAHRISGMTVKEMRFFYNMSESSIHKHIADMMEVYDAVQQEYPDVLKPRRPSESEKYMDEN